MVEGSSSYRSDPSACAIASDLPKRRSPDFRASSEVSSNRTAPGSISQQPCGGGGNIASRAGCHSQITPWLLIDATWRRKLSMNEEQVSAR